jgi:glycosyltransferase 2 family protein
LKKNQLILGLIVLAAIAALLIWGRDRIHFDFGAFYAQLAQANWIQIALSAGCIYLAYAFRSVRWAQLLKHNKHVAPFSLLGTQVIGFTGVALIGRIADPVRPYLVAKKTGLSLSSQIAVYIVERLFDAGSMAVIFSVAMLWVPYAEIMSVMNHTHTVALLGARSPALAAFAARYGGLVLTLFGALFLVAVRVAGNTVASMAEQSLGMISSKLGTAVGEKIRAFHAGLDTMRTFGEFGVTAGLSISMWLLISAAYYEGCQAFSASPELAAITPSKCVLIMVASGTASIFQLPVLGLFTQIGIVAAAITGLLGANAEAAMACATVLLLTTFLGIVPVGLVWAQFEHINLRKVTDESEHAGESIAEDNPVPENPV